MIHGWQVTTIVLRQKEKQMKQKNFRPIQPSWCSIVGIGLLVSLAACGGGGGGGEPEAEIVSVVSNGVIEGNSGTQYLEVTFNLSKNSVRGVSVTYSTSIPVSSFFGLATPSSYFSQQGRYKTCAEDSTADYVPINSSNPATLNIPVGQSTGVIQIPVCGDTVFEPNESFTVNWSTRAVVQSQVSSRSVTAVILNDEPGALASTGIKSSSPPLASSGVYVSRDDNPLTNSNLDGPAGLAYLKLKLFDPVSGVGTPAANDGEWNCTQDTVTGLVWAGGALSTRNEVGVNWTAAQSQASSACGTSAWRLPTISELMGLLDNNTPQQTGSTITQQAIKRYWSSNTFSDGQVTTGYYVDFSDGWATWASVIPLDNLPHTRLVIDPLTRNYAESSPEGARFEKNATLGVVIDHKTKLMWKICSEGPVTCDTQQIGTYSVAGAQARLATVNNPDNNLGAGFADWRMPNKNELASLIDYAASTPPLIDVSVFPDLGTSRTYWTGSPNQLTTQPSRYWYVDFFAGNVADDVATEVKRLRLVRGGQ